MLLAVVDIESEATCEEFVQGVECGAPAIYERADAEGPEARFFCDRHDPRMQVHS